MTSRNRQESAIFTVSRFLGLLWKVYTGYSAHECDHRRPGGCGANRPLEHRLALRWHHLPRYARAAVALVITAVLYGLAVARTLTLILLGAFIIGAAVAATWQCVYAVRNWQHERHHVRPLEVTLMRGIPVRPVSLEVQVRRDKENNCKVIEGVVIEWPPDTEIREPEKQLALEAVTTRLPIEAPDPKWELKGRSRIVTFTPSEPPPFPVSWEDVAPAVGRAAANELVFGVGKKATVTTATYSESPHLCAPGGSGGGKSNLIAFLLLQEMMRGSLIINLDPKWISQLWVQDLPNVISALDIPDLHLALVWLGRELRRRTRAAYYSANGTGRVHGSVGARIIVVAEELNYGMPDLKDYHAEMRAQDKSLPKKSPAVSALQSLSVAGRASDMHEWLVAQLLTVESTGVKDSTIRTNAGIKAMARHDPPGWAMAVGKHVPMPPPSDIPGRIQLVTANGVRETQVPYLHLDDPDPAVADKAVKWARELAVSGDVAKIPIGGEYGVPPQLIPACVLGQERLALPAGQEGGTAGTVPGSPPQLPPMTLSQAHAQGIYGDGNYEAVRKAVQRLEDRAPEPAERGSKGRPHKWAVEDHHAMARELERR